jgi:hypothetical protein
MPSGEPQALDELVRAVAGAAHVLAVLGDDLAGPAATAPGWLGDDAAAAAAQVGLVTELVGEIGGAVLIATGHLSAHADLLREVRRSVAALRAEQDDDHRAAWSRMSELDGLVGQIAYDGHGAVAVVEELRASEEARRRRHERLLDDLADDATAVAQVLADAGAVVGCGGRPGDEPRAVAHLAVLLPGWGDGELATRGTALAAALYRADAGWMEVLAAETASFADAPAFANALLAGLGVGGVRQLLTTLGSNERGPLPAVATMLAAAVGAAVPSGRNGRAVEKVLGAVYVRTDDRYGLSDAAAVGMAAVLLAGRSAAGGGPRPMVIVEWARQMLLREHVQGMDAGLGAVPEGMPPEASDPVGVAMDVLADTGDAAASAALLGAEDVWQALLARFWNDGGTALGQVIATAAAEPGPDGPRAVRLALEVVGGSLFEGDPREWDVSRRTVAVVSADIGRAVASHIGVAVDALSVGADGRLGEQREVLRGLAYVSLDRTAASAVEVALEGSPSDLPSFVAVDSPSALPAVTVPAAFLAVQEYGQRLTNALDGFAAKRRAENLEFLWDWTIALPTTVAGEVTRRSAYGAAFGLAEGYGAIIVGADGTWDNPVDRGLRFTSDDAADAARARWELRTDVDALAQHARGAFDRTATALGLPAPPRSPEADLMAPLEDAATGEVADRARDRVGTAVRNVTPSRPR